MEYGSLFPGLLQEKFGYVWSKQFVEVEASVVLPEKQNCS
jgi:hypothetical protein